jgi:hypothetical protein
MVGSIRKRTLIASVLDGLRWGARRTQVTRAGNNRDAAACGGCVPICTVLASEKETGVPSTRLGAFGVAGQVGRFASGENVFGGDHEVNQFHGH